MSTIRVLIVDDSVVRRRLLTEAFARSGDFEVVGIAPDSHLALQRIPQVAPDLVILDIDLPDVDGLATLRQIRVQYPGLAVIICADLTNRGAAILEALGAGACDYVAKPAGFEKEDHAVKWFCDELLPRARALVHQRRGARPDAPRSASTPPAVPVRKNEPSRGVELVCIAISTGGPNALAELFAGFDHPLPVPLAVVQHMPPMFTRLLAERLDSLPGAVRCREAVDGELMLPSTAYLAPGGRHLVVARDTAGRFIARLNDEPPENSCRPAADVLFRSAAATGAGLLAVVMTGMGYDGLIGCRGIRERGGQIVIQDEPTSVVWGMPGAVAQAGYADATRPLPELAGEITRRCLAGSSFRS